MVVQVACENDLITGPQAVRVVAASELIDDLAAWI